MNFFGHAVLAAWHRPEPSFALGAMLPDLAHMLGRARVRSEHELLAAGIGFHHRTDRVFHSSSVFVHLEAQALVSLREAGLPPGPRRALAHVGLEVLLDAELSRSAECMSVYRAALLSVEAEALAPQLSWSSARAELGDPGLVPLCQTLCSRADRLRPGSSAEVVDRLYRILEARPRLAVPAECRSKVHTWVELTWPSLVQRLPAWLAELNSGLQQEAPSRLVHATASGDCA